MNRDQRYQCPRHPAITVGATPGVAEPPTCQFDDQTMAPVTSTPTPGAAKERTVADPRRSTPPRGETNPL